MFSEMLAMGSNGGGGTTTALTDSWAGGGTKTVETPSKAKTICVYLHANGFYTNVLRDGTISETDFDYYAGNATTPKRKSDAISSLTDSSVTFTVEYNGNYQYRYVITC
jgi:hypothetical protein